MPRATLLLFLLGVSAFAQPTAAARGEKSYREFRCSQCHAPKFAARFTANGMASAMWNHTAAMSTAIERARIPRTAMTAQQAADLYAFLAGGHKAEASGDPRQGELLFRSKMCSSCHDDPVTGAPALSTKPAGKYSAYSMIAGLWMHGGGMLSRITASNKGWQQLGPEEVGHIVAFLNSRK